MAASELPPFVSRLLDEAIIIRVATTGRDGMPHVAPYWFGVRDGEIWINTMTSKTFRNLDHNPYSEVLVDLGERVPHIRGAFVLARARFIHEDDAQHANMRALVEEGHEGEVALPEFEAKLATNALPEVAIGMTPLRARWWSLENLGSWTAPE